MLRQIALNNAVLIIQYGTLGLVTLLLIPHLVHELGLSEYGALAIALAWANYGSIIVQYGFHLSGPKQINQLNHNQSEIDVVLQINSAKLTLLASVLLIFGIGAWLATHLGHSTNLPQILLLIILPIAAAMNSGWHLQATGRFATSSLISIFGALLALSIGLLFVQGESSTKLLLAALALSIGPLATGLGTFVASLKALARTGSGRKLCWVSPWEELRTGWPLFISQFVASLYSVSGPLIIGFFAGTAEAGAYSVVERVSTAVVAVCLLTHTAAYPKLAQLYLSDRTLYLKLIKFVVFTYLSFISIIVLISAPWWEHILNYLLMDTATSRDYLLAFSMLWAALSIFGPLLTGYLTVSGNSNRILAITASVLLISFTLGLPAVIAWGAWGWLASLCFGQLIVLAYAIRIFKYETTGLNRLK